MIALSGGTSARSRSTTCIIQREACFARCLWEQAGAREGTQLRVKKLQCDACLECGEQVGAHKVAQVRVKYHDVLALGGGSKLVHKKLLNYL